MRPRHTAIEILSMAVKGRAEYQVRFLCLPKPRSSMALEMVSMRSMELRTRGMRMALAAFRRLTRLTFLLISIPRACWAREISRYSRWISGM